MLLDILSNKLAIPLNNGNKEIGFQSFKTYAEYLEMYRDTLFNKITSIIYLSKNFNKKLLILLDQYSDKEVKQYYPSFKVIEFCKTKIDSSISKYPPDFKCFNDIKIFYLKEDRIKVMSAKEIKILKSGGNKEQIKHFMSLLKQANQE